MVVLCINDLCRQTTLHTQDITLRMRLNFILTDYIFSTYMKLKMYLAINYPLYIILFLESPKPEIKI